MKNGVKHYQKYDGMMLAKQYLPQVTPFQTLELVRSLADWEAIEAMLPQRVLGAIVRRRVENTMLLTAKQRRLTGLVPKKPGKDILQKGVELA